MSIILHCGSETVERNALSGVVLPPETPTHQPIAHDYFVNLVQDKLEDRGLRVVDEIHGLNNKGANYFGMFQVAGQDLVTPDYSLMIGMRNSHTKKFAAGIAAGASVFVCDNLSFSGEVKATRKHTGMILDDLPVRIVEAIEGVVGMAQFQNVRFEAYKARQLATFEAEHLMIEMLRLGIMNAHRLPKLVQQWDTPDHDEFARTGRSAWRMFNAATEALKGTNAADLARKTEKLHTLTDEVVELAA
jgi:hypothetical protein